MSFAFLTINKFTFQLNAAAATTSTTEYVSWASCCPSTLLSLYTSSVLSWTGYNLLITNTRARLHTTRVLAKWSVRCASQYKVVPHFFCEIREFLQKEMLSQSSLVRIK